MLHDPAGICTNLPKWLRSTRTRSCWPCLWLLTQVWIKCESTVTSADINHHVSVTERCFWPSIELTEVSTRDKCTIAKAVWKCSSCAVTFLPMHAGIWEMVPTSPWLHGLCSVTLSWSMLVDNGLVRLEISFTRALLLLYETLLPLPQPYYVRFGNASSDHGEASAEGKLSQQQLWGCASHGRQLCTSCLERSLHGGWKARITW